MGKNRIIYLIFSFLLYVTPLESIGNDISPIIFDKERRLVSDPLPPHDCDEQFIREVNNKINKLLKKSKEVNELSIEYTLIEKYYLDEILKRFDTESLKITKNFQSNDDTALFIVLRRIKKNSLFILRYINKQDQQLKLIQKDLDEKVRKCSINKFNDRAIP